MEAESFTIKNNDSEWSGGLSSGLQLHQFICRRPTAMFGHSLWFLSTRWDLYVCSLAVVLLLLYGCRVRYLFFTSYSSALSTSAGHYHCSRGLAKGIHQNNTPPAVRIKPAIYRLQIRLFIDWAILASIHCGDPKPCDTKVEYKVCWRPRASAVWHANWSANFSLIPEHSDLAFWLKLVQWPPVSLPLISAIRKIRLLELKSLVPTIELS